jgi:putative PIN family toxin of toxin-antitoxin system
VIVVVADTNTLVSGLGWSGPPAQIVEAVLAGQLVLASSPALLAELERVLAYPKLARVFPDPEGLVARLRTVVDLVQPTFELAVVADEPDNRVLEAAVAVRADAIVTGDGGLLVLGDHDGIPVLSAAAFIEWWSTAR